MFLTSLKHFLKSLSLTKKKRRSNHTESVDTEGRNLQCIDDRRYNNNEHPQYLLTNDNDGVDRLHKQHWLLKDTFQCNFHAPVDDDLKKGISVLDSGCGPATWLFEMAESYPNSHFTGIDVSFIFPEAIKPPNVDLQICNVAHELPFPDNTFDYVHQRLLVLELIKSDYQAALKNLYRVVKPGACIELVEFNYCRFENMGPMLQRMQQVNAATVFKKGMVANLGDALGFMLEEAGFVGIDVLYKKIPLNHTNKSGELWWKDLAHEYSNIRPMMAMINPAFKNSECYAEHMKSVGDECTRLKTNGIIGIAVAKKPFDEYE
ncbi:S-adenosyl-L-methionine-dependent methyltransferase [Pilobolus umbonatus]|nr:S-adenosyl-L-methionine-dependent methyltransferase [Pilobolus umbonatus]